MSLMSDTKVTDNVSARQEVVEDGTKYLADRFIEYVQEHKDITLIDVFMMCHSFHKLIVNDVAARWELEGIEASKTYQMADLTFRQAMRDLRRRLPSIQSAQAPDQT